MEIVDELMTPGCPQCYVKHMSAALSYAADHHGFSAPAGEILVARAVVNFTEVIEGYRSHYEFALGLLARAEQELVADGFVEEAKLVRNLRATVIPLAVLHGANAAVERLSALPSGSAYLLAHVAEAERELRLERQFPTSAEEIASMIEAVRKEYFDLPEVETPKGKGGEEAMACAKEAACKGGKCAAKASAKKAACKGGKCKK